MTTMISQSAASIGLLSARQRWEAPAIVLERSLEVSAQDGPPSNPNLAPSGVLGPLCTSCSPTGPCA
jgi:hypothetical protein